MEFSPWFPILPMKQNQPWGTYDPKDYEQFGFTRHNGIDIAMAPDKTVRAPYKGTIVRVGNQPTGGGIFCGLLSDDAYDFPPFTCKTPEGVVVYFPAATCYVLFDFLHMDSLSVKEGQKMEVGDIVGIQDNTGFTTGPHTHIQSRREQLQPAAPQTPPSYRYLNDQMLVDVDKNEANNSFDPTQLWNQKFAEMYQVAEKALASADVLVHDPSTPIPQKISRLQAIIADIKNLFHWN